MHEMCGDKDLTKHRWTDTEWRGCPEERETAESPSSKLEILVFLLPFYSQMFGEMVQKHRVEEELTNDTTHIGGT